jgi:hypothetical protein
MKGRAVPSLVVCLLLTGCVSPENDRDTIGRATKLEAFETPKAAESVVVPPALAAPSVIGIERGNWQKTVILVPVDGTAHKPTYARRITDTNKTRRQRSLYPTATSSLELGGGSEGQQQSEMLYNQLMTLGDLIFWPFRMIWRAPWRTDASPDEGYSRYAHPELPPGQRQPLPEESDPFAHPSPRSVTP